METMMDNFIVNEQVIENLRAHLNQLIADHGEDELLHPDVVEFSQLLDNLISAYTVNNLEQNQQ